jgi:MFS transporter, FHS family, glucose/mannose:H+ symporter
MMNQNADHYHGSRTNYRLLFYVVCLINTTAGIALILPAATLPLLVAHTHILLEFAGWIFAAFSSGTMLNAIVLGAFDKRINPKYLLIGGMAILGTTSLVVAWTHVFVVLLIVQFFAGIGFGFIYVSSNVLTTLLFLDTLSEMLNKIVSSFSMGALLGPLFLSLALQVSGEPIWAFGVVTFLACVTIGYLLFVDVPKAAVLHKTHQKIVVPSKHIFKDVVFWLALSQMFLYLGTQVGFSNWIVTVVSKATSVTLALAAPAETLFWFGLMSGSMACAFLWRRNLINERLVLYYCFVGGCLSDLLVVSFPGNIWICFAASLLMGCFLGPIFPSIMAITSRHFVTRLGFVSSAMSFCGELAACACPATMGLIIVHFGVSWAMLLPALSCLLITIPFSLAWWWQTRTKTNLAPEIAHYKHQISGSLGHATHQVRVPL